MTSVMSINDDYNNFNFDSNFLRLEYLFNFICYKFKIIKTFEFPKNPNCQSCAKITLAVMVRQ